MKYIDSLTAQSVLTLTLSEPQRETSRAPGVMTNTLNSIQRAFNTFLTTGLALPFTERHPAKFASPNHEGTVE